MIGSRAEEVLNRAVRFAFERKHEYFTLEHVLLSLMEETEILEVIQACGGSYIEIKKELENYLEIEIPKAGNQVTKEDSEAAENAEEILESPVATLSIQRLVQRALFHVQSAGKDEIEPEDLFIALFQSKDSFSLTLLTRQGVDRLDAINYISHGIIKDEDVALAKEGSTEDGLQGRPKKGKPDSTPNALELYTTDLNKLAKAGAIDPLIGRANELERIIQTLCRRRKNNPLLVGEAGVGKTALAEGLALRVVSGDIPKLLEKMELYSLDMGSLLAGAKFRGDFEQRLKKVIKALTLKKEAGGVPVLVIDEIHTIIGAGAVSGGTLDAANLLKPVLSRGEIKCIGSTTYNEYRNVFEKDHALARRFQKDKMTPVTNNAVTV